MLVKELTWQPHDSHTRHLTVTWVTCILDRHMTVTWLMQTNLVSVGHKPRGTPSENVYHSIVDVGSWNGDITEAVKVNVTRVFHSHSKPACYWWWGVKGSEAPKLFKEGERERREGEKREEEGERREREGERRKGQRDWGRKKRKT